MTVDAWSGKRGSDPRPQPWQGCALPTELFPRFGKQRYDIFLAFASFSALFCIPFLFFPSVWPLGRRISHHYHSPHGHHARPPAHRSAPVARPLSLSRRNHLAPRASHRPATATAHSGRSAATYRFLMTVLPSWTSTSITLSRVIWPSRMERES